MRNGVGKDGAALCTFMTRYTAAELPDSDVKDIYAFLRTQLSDTPQKGSLCP